MNQRLAMRIRPRLYDLAAAGLAAGLSLFEIVRVISARGVTPGHSTMSTLMGAIAFSGILGIAAIGLALHRKQGWLFGIFGVIAAAAHGIIVRVGGSRVGIAYIFGAAILLALLIKDLHWYRTEKPIRQA